MEKLTRVITLPVSQYQATIREGDGYAEKMLFAQEDKLHLAYPDFWAMLTLELNGKKPDRDDILRLVLPDQRTLAIDIFKLSYGNMLKLTAKCGKCGKPANYDVDLNKLPFKSLPEGLAPPDPVRKLKLPRDKRIVTLGYITGAQEIEEADSEDFDPNRNDFKWIRHIEGKDKVSYEDVVALPLMDHKAIREVIAEMACGYDTMVNFKHSCGRINTQNVLTDPSFLMPGFAG